MIITVQTEHLAEAVKKELAGLGVWISDESILPGGGVHLVVSSLSDPLAPSTIEKIRSIATVSLSPSKHPRVDALPQTVDLGALELTPERPCVIAGPCAVESEDQIERIAAHLSARGVRLLRGGAYKPRTSPYSFQGVGSTGWQWLKKAADRNDMKVVTEVTSEQDLGAARELVDVIQIGSRNMHNGVLLRAIGGLKKPVVLKRGLSATIEEWLLAAEYVLTAGATSVIFCERGIRGFDDKTRNVLDLGAAALLSNVYRLPVIVDPSHATGRRDLILPLARAALSLGVVGVMIEVHDRPNEARSDAPQALHPDALLPLLTELSKGRS